MLSKKNLLIATLATALTGCNQQSQGSAPVTPEAFSLDDLKIAVASNERLASILAYRLIQSGRSTPNESDLSSIEAAQKQLLDDYRDDRYFTSMAEFGADIEVRPMQSGYVIRDKWQVSTEQGSIFENSFPAGARLVLSSETIVKPTCENGRLPLLVYSELPQIGSQPVGLDIIETERMWRPVLKPSNDTWERRIIVNTGCAAEPAAAGN